MKIPQTERKVEREAGRYWWHSRSGNCIPHFRLHWSLKEKTISLCVFLSLPTPLPSIPTGFRLLLISKYHNGMICSIRKANQVPERLLKSLGLGIERGKESVIFIEGPTPTIRLGGSCNQSPVLLKICLVWVLSKLLQVLWEKILLPSWCGSHYEVKTPFLPWREQSWVFLTA